MEDIAPALYDKIKADFDAKVSNDAQIQRILKRIEDGTATARDTQYYAIRIGKHAADAFKENISSEVLPDGKMYYNIAERTVVPQLIENYELVEGVAEAVQQQLNADAGIGLNPVHVDVNQSRIDGIVNRITAADVYDTVAWMLVEPVRNFTQSVADDFVRENVAFQSKAGLSPKITREVYGNCCAWCAALAGTYEYKKEPKDFYRKHEYCRCLIIYDPGKGKVQNSHTKEWFQSERDARISHVEELRQEETVSPAARERRLMAAQEGEKVSIPDGHVGNFDGFGQLSISEESREAIAELNRLAVNANAEYSQIFSPTGRTTPHTDDTFDGVKIEYNKIDGDNLRVYHAHTNVTPFSSQDFYHLTNPRVDEIGVISANGDTYIARIGYGYRPTYDELEKLLYDWDKNLVIDNFIKEYPDYYEWSPEERFYMFSKERTYQLCRYYKWEIEGGNIVE